MSGSTAAAIKGWAEMSSAACIIFYPLELALVNQLSLRSNISQFPTWRIVSPKTSRDSPYVFWLNHKSLYSNEMIIFKQQHLKITMAIISNWLLFPNNQAIKFRSKISSIFIHSLFYIYLKLIRHDKAWMQRRSCLIPRCFFHARFTVHDRSAQQRVQRGGVSSRKGCWTYANTSVSIKKEPLCNFDEALPCEYIACNRVQCDRRILVANCRAWKRCGRCLVPRPDRCNWL